MKQIAINVLSLALILVLGLLTVTQSCENRDLKKALTREKTEHAIISGLWQKLISQPPKVVTTVKVVTVKGTTPIKPTPSRTDTIWLTDSTSKVTVSYEDTYSIGDSVLIDWYATTTGTLDSFQVTRATYPSHITTIERMIPPLPTDTSKIIAPYLNRNHLGIYLGGTGNSLAQFPNPQAGFFWTIRDRWGLQPGLQYNIPDGKVLLSFNLLLYLK